MRGDALKHAMAASLAGIPLTGDEKDRATVDAVELLIGFVNAVERIAEAAEKVAQCADGVHPSAFRIIQQD